MNYLIQNIQNNLINFQNIRIYEKVNFYWFFYIFLDFRWFFFKNIILYMKMEPGWWRMGPEYILEYFWIWKRPKRPHLGRKSRRILWNCCFLLGRKPVFLKASGCVSCIGPPAAFFRENDISGFFGHVHFLKKWIFLIFGDFSKMAPQAKPLCPYERYRNSVQNPGLKVSRASTRAQFHRDKLQI